MACGTTHYQGCECHEARHAAEIAELKAEAAENARIIGMSGERELALRAELEKYAIDDERLKDKVRALDAELERKGKQIAALHNRTLLLGEENAKLREALEYQALCNHGYSHIAQAVLDGKPLDAHCAELLRTWKGEKE
jgi:chromosome segregation ATPase